MSVILDGDVKVVGSSSGCGLDIRALLLYLPRASVLVLVNFLFCPSLGIARGLPGPLGSDS